MTLKGPSACPPAPPSPLSPPPPCTLPMAPWPHAPRPYQMTLKGPSACPPVPPSPLSPPPPPAPPTPSHNPHALPCTLPMSIAWRPCPRPPGTHGSWPHGSTPAPCPQPQLQLMAPGFHMAATTHKPLLFMHVSHGPVAPCPAQMTLKSPVPTHAHPDRPPALTALIAPAPYFDQKTGEGWWQMPDSEVIRLVLQADQGGPLYTAYQWCAAQGYAISFIRDESSFGGNVCA